MKWSAIIKQVNLKSWASVPAQLNIGLLTQSGVGVPTGVGEECVSENCLEDLTDIRTAPIALAG